MKNTIKNCLKIVINHFPTVQDLDEDVVITLMAKNPQAQQGLARFDYTSGEYVSVKYVEMMIDHLVSLH